MISHEDGPQLPIQRRHHGADALVIGLADGFEPHEETHAAADVHRVLVPGSQTVEIVGGVDHRHVTELLPHLEELSRRGGEE